MKGRDVRERRQLRERRDMTPSRQQRERMLRSLVVLGVVASVGVFAAVANARDSGVAAPGEVEQAGGGGSGGVAPAAMQAAPTTTTGEQAKPIDTTVGEGSLPADSLPDLAGDSPSDLTDDCKIAPETVTSDADPTDVKCLQQALQREGFYSGPISGQLDGATSEAIRNLQIERDLYIDGIAGRETGLELGIWPDEQMFVVRTPPPAPGAKDALGFPLSSVATTGKDAPPLPENSGSGKRVVYERISQRVWAVSENEEVVRSWLVAGSQYNNEVPGTHYIYSRSEQSTAWNGRAILPLMIRWYQTEIGHIGFHGIPIHVSDGSPYMTEAELGQRLSGGCQRQSNLDAQFLWYFAPVGTKVVVL